MSSDNKIYKRLTLYKIKDTYININKIVYFKPVKTFLSGNVLRVCYGKQLSFIDGTSTGNSGAVCSDFEFESYPEAEDEAEKLKKFMDGY